MNLSADVTTYLFWPKTRGTSDLRVFVTVSLQ